MSSTFRDGKIVRDAATPVRAERFVVGTPPEQFAKQLNALQEATVEATEAARRNRGNSKVTFEDIACGTAGATVVLRHGLGRRARWRVVDWTRTTPGGTHGLERSATGNDENTLTLASYVAGTATIEVE
ncbi:MAG: hypothetical protein KBF56_04740 [Gemmatimonadaceae bacterium]|nr:hypothetical protein [Gemmatimonadaceae bacterium]